MKCVKWQYEWFECSTTCLVQSCIFFFSTLFCVLHCYTEYFTVHLFSNLKSALQKLSVYEQGRDSMCTTKFQINVKLDQGAFAKIFIVRLICFSFVPLTVRHAQLIVG